MSEEPSSGERIVGPDGKVSQGLGRSKRWVYAPVLSFVLGLTIGSRAADLPGGAPNAGTEISYLNDRDSSVPWSIHVVRVPRGKSYELRSAHARGKAVGLGRLSEQAAALVSPLAQPMAAINGDFYQRGGAYAGDPRGLQMIDGDLISAPSGSVSFWIDALGEPHATNTMSEFQVIWPDGRSSGIGLNGERGRNEIELYTAALGSSTQTSGGREFILEQTEKNPWLPLRPGRIYRGRVREVRDSGDSRLFPGTMVLSVGPSLVRSLPRIPVGSELVISTATQPSLRGARTAISGGPILIREGRRQRIAMPEWDSYQTRSMLERHPRAALGWNDDFYFLVEVDGRQRNLSVGMTLSELASYMIRLGCREAMGLDGGGSATLWYDGKVRNSPCDSYERMIANSVVVVRRKETPTTEKAPARTAAIAPAP